MKLNVIKDDVEIVEKDALEVFRDLDPQIKENVKVRLNEEGLKQEDKLNHPYYIVEKVYLASLGDMKTWMIRLENTDKNVINPYLAHHFKIYEE